MKVVSFNVNGLRARFHQLEALVELHRPDILALQEIKVHDDEFPRDEIERLGYVVEHHGQKGHYGVALLTRIEPETVRRGFPSDPADAQRRFIEGVYPLADGRRLRVLNGYFPQGESREHPEKFPAKERFYADLTTYLQETMEGEDLLLLAGDMNIAPLDIDLGIGPDNVKRWLRTGKCCFLPEEREWLQGLVDCGLRDTFRLVHPEADDRFSWFDYRSKGFDAEPKRGLRIDLMLASTPLAQHVTGAGIDYTIRGMERPSDHAPVWVEFDLPVPRKR